MRNPFGADYNSDSEGDEGEGQAIEVDLTSWGLDAFIPKDKSKSAKSRGKQPIPPPVTSTRSHRPSTNHDSTIPLARSGVVTSRALSAGGSLEFPTQDTAVQAPDRRRSFGSPLDLVGMEPTGLPLQRRRGTSQGSIPSRPSAVPFPSSSLRSPSPGADQLYRDPRPHERAHSMASMTSRMYDDMSQNHGSQPHERTQSMASMGSRLMHDDMIQDYRPPLHERTQSMASMGSRLVQDDLTQDSKPRPHERTHSMASMSSRLMQDDKTPDNIQPERFSSSDTELENADDNPFAIHRSSHTSRFDPKSLARTRTQSSASMGSRMVLENDTASVMTGARNAYSREPRYATTLDLLRPKVLVMPSPLQAVTPSIPKQPTHSAREGFEISKDGPPLPPGARSSRRLSSTSIIDTEIVPLASNPFIPNPHIDLSLSQKTFRNTLVAGGRSGTYLDVNQDLPRATEDGEQVMVEEPPKEETLPPPTPPLEEDPKVKHPAGKLYGKSLIDDLEKRKAEMRNKQRYLFFALSWIPKLIITCSVFTGDERPSMMARAQRPNTLIDPASLKTPPTSRRLSTLQPQQTLSRQNSLSMKPLLNFDEEDGKALGGRLPPTRSVFGVDTLWEREMVKLREIETLEAREKEERMKLEGETERKRIRKKNKRKKKRRSSKDDEDVQQVHASAHVSSVEPPTLPNIQRATRTVPPTANAYDSSSESGGEREQPRPSAVTPAWHENSSDEEDAGPRRTTGVGLRNPKVSRKISISHDDDSEEDLPLAATIHKAAARAALGVTQAGADSDEDRPLSHIILQAKAKLPPPKSTFYERNQPAEDEDDDQPLGLRTSRFVQSRPNADDEDDMPLAFHPEQRRRTQYQMLAQQQHQQQMMMQAQMQSNMLMSASMMGPGYFTPLVHPMSMMQVPIPVPSPPPMNDEVKFGRVDRWRRDIVVDE